MSNDSKKFTKEQRAAIALKAASGGADEIKRLAEEHGVSEKIIKEWIRETGADVVEDENEEYSLEATEEFSKQVEHGVTYDKLNYGRLTFWSVFGTAVILIMILAIMAVHNYTSTGATQQASERSLYYNIEQIQNSDRTRLESFGVVDPDEGIYHIPIDSAITIMAREFE